MEKKNARQRVENTCLGIFVGRGLEDHNWRVNMYIGEYEFSLELVIQLV